MFEELEQEVRQILGPMIRTHWGRRIVAAAKRGRFTRADKVAAEDWGCCVCGKMHIRKLFGRDSGTKKPFDKFLCALGVEFDVAVREEIPADGIRHAAHLIAVTEHQGSQLTRTA